MVISWSFLRAFEKCPFQQKLIRIDKVRPKRIDERRFITGAVGHKFFELWARRGFDNELNPKTAGRIFDRLIRRKFIKWRDATDCSRVRKRVINEASLLIEAVHQHGIDKINDAQIESFLLKPLPDGQNYVGGIIDFIANNGSRIIELKMSADPIWADPDQLIFYGLLLATIQRRYPSRLTLLLPIMQNVEDRLVDIAVSNYDYLKMYTRLNDVILKWGEGIFPSARNPKTCCYCSVRNYCNQF
jgi:hypothetical protein